MIPRRSLGLSITLGTIMIVLLLALAVGWVLLWVFSGEGAKYSAFFWTLLLLGITFLVLVIVGVVMYLVLTIKAINLSRRQSNFIDSVTHELKSPIASLKLYLQTLNRRHLSPQDQEAFLGFMLEDVERLDRLIDHLLDAARLDKFAAPTAAEEIDLGQLLSQAAANVLLLYRVKPDSVRYDLQPCFVQAVRSDLEMVVRNLLDNAVKYSGEPPQISVALHCTPSGQAVIRVGDNGPGIPPHLRKKIFGRFVRLGSELERKTPGTGLGLHIVHTLVKRLQGEVRVVDPVQGSGTVFEIRLPHASRTSAAASAIQTDSAVAAGEEPPHDHSAVQAPPAVRPEGVAQ